MIINDIVNIKNDNINNNEIDMTKNNTSYSRGVVPINKVQGRPPCKHVSRVYDRNKKHSLFRQLWLFSIE